MPPAAPTAPAAGLRRIMPVYLRGPVWLGICWRALLRIHRVRDLQLRRAFLRLQRMRGRDLNPVRIPAPAPNNNRRADNNMRPGKLLLLVRIKFHHANNADNNINNPRPVRPLHPQVERRELGRDR